MGVGDNILATGIARGAAKRGVRIGFGDGRKVLWDTYSEMIFRHNPNIASPREREAENIEWVPFYRGHRMYNRNGGDRWIWNYEFKATPGEFFFSREERRFGDAFGQGFVIIEPSLPAFKKTSVNKAWPTERYQAVADALRGLGFDVAQFVYRDSTRLSGVRTLATPNFRLAAAAMRRAGLYVGPEGGLHHCAAAVDVRAVVLFGGWVPPAVTGYEAHVNLTGGETEACGMFTPCPHCRAAMLQISVDEVVAASMEALRPRESPPGA